MNGLSTQIARGRSKRSIVAIARERAATVALVAMLPVLPIIPTVRLVAQTSARTTAFSSSAAENKSGVQGVATDPRWFAWLGCWQADTSGSVGTKCIVPAAGTNTVDEVTLMGGRIVARDRLDFSGRPNQIRQQGCDGSEIVSWSKSGRRAFLRTDYICASGIKATSTRIFAIAPSGDWLEVETVRSGNGSIEHVSRRRDTGAPVGAPREVTSFVGTQQLAVSAARANAATPLTIDDVVEALHATDGATVRTWLVATNQAFDLDAQQVMALVGDDVPTSVLQAMISSVPPRQLGLAPMGSATSNDYLNTPVYAPGVVNQVMPMVYPTSQLPYGATCGPDGCVGPNPYSAYNGSSFYPSLPYSSYVPYPFYSAPIIVRRGHDGFRRPNPRHPAPINRRPVGRRP